MTMNSTVRARSAGGRLYGPPHRPRAGGWTLRLKGRKTSTDDARAPRRSAKKDEKENFGDELLDFMYAGKKLRKWYGETDMVLPQDGGPVPDDDGGGGPEKDDRSLEDIPRTSVVVLYPEDDRFPMSEQTLLELIVLRAEVLVVTNDVARAKQGYGQYVEAIKLDSGKATRRALAGAKSVVVCGAVNKQVAEVLRMAKGGAGPGSGSNSGSEGLRVVLLVAGRDAGAPGGILGGLFESAERKELKNAGRRQALAGSGIEVVEVGLKAQQRGKTAREMATKAMAMDE